MSKISQQIFQTEGPGPQRGLRIENDVKSKTISRQIMESQKNNANEGPKSKNVVNRKVIQAAQSLKKNYTKGSIPNPVYHPLKNSRRAKKNTNTAERSKSLHHYLKTFISSQSVNNIPPKKSEGLNTQLKQIDKQTMQLLETQKIQSKQLGDRLNEQQIKNNKPSILKSKGNYSQSFKNIHPKVQLEPIQQRQQMPKNNLDNQSNSIKLSQRLDVNQQKNDKISQPKIKQQLSHQGKQYQRDQKQYHITEDDKIKVYEALLKKSQPKDSRRIKVPKLKLDSALRRSNNTDTRINHLGPVTQGSLKLIPNLDRKHFQQNKIAKNVINKPLKPIIGQQQVSQEIRPRSGRFYKSVLYNKHLNKRVDKVISKVFNVPRERNVNPSPKHVNIRSYMDTPIRKTEVIRPWDEFKYANLGNQMKSTYDVGSAVDRIMENVYF